MTDSMLEVDAVEAVLAVLATLIMVGLGFLYRATRATLLWSMMFLLITLGAFGTLVAEATGMHWIDDISVGFMLGAPALVWSGLRAYRGASSYPWVAPVQGALGAAALAVTFGLPVHALVFALVYFAATVMAALSAFELIRRPERGAGLLLPLTAVSLVLPVVGIAGVASAAVSFGAAQHSVLPDVKALGQVIFITCALVTLLHLARYAEPATELRTPTEFAHVARDRLQRAAAADDRTWSMLSLSLDDTGPLRVAVGEAGFQRILARFTDDARASFPAEADIGPDAPHGLLVLLARPEAVVRDCIRDFLERLGTVTPDQPISIEFSASVGWAPVRAVGYDAVVLIDAAHAAMQAARDAGGNRWERVDAPTPVSGRGG
jgi:hypothetical protein